MIKSIGRKILWVLLFCFVSVFVSGNSSSVLRNDLSHLLSNFSIFSLSYRQSCGFLQVNGAVVQNIIQPSCDLPFTMYNLCDNHETEPVNYPLLAAASSVPTFSTSHFLPFSLSPVPTFSTSSQLKSAIYSTGTSGNWSEPQTWVGRRVPAAEDDVVIASGTTVIISGEGAEVGSLTIMGTLNIIGASTLNVRGDWTHHGTFNAGSMGIVEFSGETPAMLSGTITTNFQSLVINKGNSRDSRLDLYGAVSIDPGGQVNLANGLLKINSGGSFLVNRLVRMEIPPTAGIQVDGGLLITEELTIVNRGLFQVSQGTVLLGQDKGISLQTGHGGTFGMEDGNLNLAGRLLHTEGSALLSGGTILISTDGNDGFSQAGFEVSEVAQLSITGGTVAFNRSNALGISHQDIRMAGGSNKTITGGTFRMGSSELPLSRNYVISSGVALHNLNIEGSRTKVSLSDDLTVNNQLTLNAPLLVNEHILEIGPDAPAIAGRLGDGAGMVVATTGEIRKRVNAYETFTFPLGDASPAMAYAPVTLTFTEGSFGPDAVVSVKVFNTRHPQDLGNTPYLNRYWKVQTSSIDRPKFNMKATYQPYDMEGLDTQMTFARFDKGQWIKDGFLNLSSRLLSVQGVSDLSQGFSSIASDSSNETESISPLVQKSATITQGETDVQGMEALADLATATMSGNATICAGASANLSVTLTGTANWSITYTDGTTPVTINDIATSPYQISVSPTVPTTYTLTKVTNVDGDGSVSGSATITVNPLLAASVTIAASPSGAVCSGRSVTYTASPVNGGTPVYQWKKGGVNIPGATNSSYSYVPLHGDVISVQMTSNATPCLTGSPASSNAISMIVNSLPEPTIIPGSAIACYASTGNIYSTQGGMSGYGWTVSSGGTISSGLGTNSIAVTWNVAGSQTVTVNYINSNGCTAPSPTVYNVTVNPVPVATAPIGLTYCNGILSDPFPLSGTPVGAVLFDISGGSSIGLPNENGVSAIPAFTPLTGTATLTIIPKANGCAGLPVSFNVTVRPTPTATITGGATICQNSAPPNLSIANPGSLTVLVTYNINETGSNSVNIPANSNVLVGVPTNTAGTFIYKLVSVQYLNSEPPSCPNTSVTGTATVNVIAQPVPTITGPNLICAETLGHVYTTEAGMSNYSWAVSAGGTITAGGTLGSNTVTVTWNTGGTHNVSVGYTNASGCPSSTPKVFPVTVYPIPIPTITGSTSACVGSTNKVYSTQPGMTDYQWTVSAGGTITAGGTTTSTSVTVTWNTVGSQTIGVNYKNANGCMAASPTSKNVAVTPLPLPTIVGPDLLCAGTTGNVYTTQGGMTGYIWSVSAGGTITSGGTSTSPTVTIRWNTSGPQTVGVSYTNAGGCTPSIPTVFPVTVNPMPVPTITGPTSACVGSTGNVYTTETGMANYVWTIAPGGIVTAGGGAADHSVTVTWNTVGTKTVLVNYANANNCTATNPTVSNVTVHALPVLVITGPENVCVGSTGKVYSTLAGMSNYVWMVSAGGTITSGGTSADHQVTVTWNTTGAQTVALNYTNANGCNAATANVYTVTVNPFPTPSFTTGAATGCTGNAGTVYTTQAGMTGYSWALSAGGTLVAGGTGTDNTATVVWNNTGTQSISVNYYNSNGCTASTPTQFNVNVLASTPPTCPADLVVCSNTANFNLTGGLPDGGIYSGAGVTFVNPNYIFNPATAGVGTHIITYTLANACSDKCTYTIKVNPIPVGSASAQTICSGDSTNIVLNSTVPETTFTWTVAKESGSTVTGTADCMADCGTVIRQKLDNTTYTSAGVYRYTVTPFANGCSGTPFIVDVNVNPVMAPRNISWNSNFDQNTFEVCVGGSVLSDNDLDIIPAPANNSYNGLNPTWEYAVTPDGPWLPAPGVWSTQGNYQWTVASELMDQIGDYYFRFTLTNANGCTSGSDIAEVHIISTLTVEAGPPDFICSSANIPAFSLTGASVGGYSSTTKTGTWSASPNVGTFVQNTANPGTATFRPPNNYVGDITLTLTTNDPDGAGQCEALTDVRIVHVLAPEGFAGCLATESWPLVHANSDGSVAFDCASELTGSDNGSGSLGDTDIAHCTGTGNVTFNWSFSSPENLPVLHNEDLQINRTSSTGRSISVNGPTNLSADDMVIVFLHFNTDPGTITPPEGQNFILINRTPDSGGTATVASYYKIATASEPASYAFATQNNVNTNSRIESVRVTGHNATTPIGATNETINAGTDIISGYRTITIPSLNTTAANSLLVGALTVTNTIQYPEAPSGMETFYFNDSQTAVRDASQLMPNAGATGDKIFKWPTYGSVNQNAYPAAAQMFVINPAPSDVDAAYYLVNGLPTLLGSTNGASGYASVAVESGSTIGFRVRTNTNTGGPGKLTIYNLTVPNDVPVITGIDSIVTPGCQSDLFIPTFTDPSVTDDCGASVIKTGYPITGPVTINGCDRMQKKTWIYVDECGAESLPFIQTALWSVISPFTVSCPVDPLLEPCSDPAVITAAYNTWIAGFVVNGGCAAINTNIISAPPLILNNITCGDTLRFTFIASDLCGQMASCTSTFTVKPINTLDVICPADPMLPACSDNVAIAAAYNTWKAGFSFTGGCTAVTDNIGTIPALTDLSCGGQLTFIYTASNTCGQSQSCASTFTVAPPTKLTMTVPSGVSLPLCSSASDIQSAYDNWKAGFTTSGGCAVITNILEFPALGDLSCGGSLSFTFQANNDLIACPDAVEATSTFTVADAPELTVSCPVDPNIPGCLGIQAITDAYDTWVDGFTTSGGCNVSTNIASIPPLGDMVCNGQITFTYIVDNGTGGCGGHVECTSTFTIGSSSPIIVEVPSDLTVQGCNTNEAITDIFNAWKAQFGYTGGCNVSSTDLSVYTIPNSCGGSVTIEYTASDECGQSVIRSASFTLNPEVLTLSCPGDEVQPACQDQAAIDAAFVSWKAQFGYSGGCGTVSTDLSSIAAPSACGGTILVNYSAADICGQVSNCSAIFTIDVTNNSLQGPTFTVPADITIYKNSTCDYNADPETITGVPTNLADNCTEFGNLLVRFDDAIAVGSCASSTIITRTWTVTDNCLNETTKTQIITVLDNIAPVVACPVAGFITPSDFDLPYVTYSIPAFDYSDNCTAKGDIKITWILTGDTNGSGSGIIPTPYQFNTGYTTVSYTFTDLCGNATVCSFTITALSPPDTDCLLPLTYHADTLVCIHRLPSDTNNPGVPTNNKSESLDWTWTIINPNGTTGATGTSTGITALPIDPYDFRLGKSIIRWRAINFSGSDTCSQFITVLDNRPPSFEADGAEFCVEPISGAVYTGNADDLDYTVDFPAADYYIFRDGSLDLDVDLLSYQDNCCSLADGYNLRWTIDFEGNDPSEPTISGTGQPSAYGADLHLWGDGLSFLNRVHILSFWMTDCHGNESEATTVNIIINPRPNLMKVP